VRASSCDETRFESVSGWAYQETGGHCMHALGSARNIGMGFAALIATKLPGDSRAGTRARATHRMDLGGERCLCAAGGGAGQVQTADAEGAGARAEARAAAGLAAGVAAAAAAAGVAAVPATRRLPQVGAAWMWRLAFEHP